jgi:predicted transcriptional regulator
MNPKPLSRVWGARCGSHTQKLVLICIAHHARDDGSNSFASIATIARECNLHERNVRRTIKQLEADGRIFVHRPARQHRKITNRYTIAIELGQRLIEFQAVEKGGVPPPLIGSEGGRTVPEGGRTALQNRQEQGERGARKRVALAFPIPTESEWLMKTRSLGIPDGYSRAHWLRQEAAFPPWGKARGNLDAFAELVKMWWQEDGFPPGVRNGNGHKPTFNQSEYEKEFPLLR